MFYKFFAYFLWRHKKTKKKRIVKNAPARNTEMTVLAKWSNIRGDTVRKARAWLRERNLERARAICLNAIDSWSSTSGQRRKSSTISSMLFGRMTILSLLLTTEIRRIVLEKEEFASSISAAAATIDLIFGLIWTRIDAAQREIKKPAYQLLTTPIVNMENGSVSKNCKY